MIRSDYLKPLFDPKKLESILDKITIAIDDILGFDNLPDFSFVVKGYSSALVSPLLAMAFNCPIVLVREKEFDRISHSSLQVEGNDSLRKYVIIDDCLITGNTIKEIVRSLDEFQPKARLIGIVLYGKNDKQQMQAIADRYSCFVKCVHGKQTLVNPEVLS
jgi:hypothetical protein